QARVAGGGVRPAAPPVPPERRCLGRRPRRARQGDRGWRTRAGVGVSPARAATARAAAPRGREGPRGVRGPRGQNPTVRPGDRRGNGGRPRGPREPWVGVLELGRRRRYAALLRGPLRRAA